MQQSAVPRCAILSGEPREASGSETPRVHNVARQRGGVAAHSAGAAAGEGIRTPNLSRYDAASGGEGRAAMRRGDFIDILGCGGNLQ